MPIAVLMPVYNDGAFLHGMLSALRAASAAAGGITVVLVDDGSSRAVDPRSLPGPTATYRTILLRHVVNLGQGAALETARQVALAIDDPTGPFSAYVTMDSDGQHRVADALTLAEAVAGGADVAFGNRFLGGSNVPTLRRLLLMAARRFERRLTGLSLMDAHNGLRAFSRAALERTPIRHDRMAHATEIKQRVSRARIIGGDREPAEGRPLRVVEVPVTVRYTAETLAKGQRSLGAIDIVSDLVHAYLFREPR